MDLTSVADGSKNTPGKILQVNHAGEFGAINIYRAQIAIARLTGAKHLGLLEEFLLHEKEHHRIPLLLKLKLSSFSWLVSWSFWKVILIIIGVLAALYLVGICLNKADQFLKQRLPFKAYAAYLAFGRLMLTLMYVFVGAMLYRGYTSGSVEVYVGILMFVCFTFMNAFREVVGPCK